MTTPPPDWQQGFDALLGYEIDDISDEEVRAHLDVRDELRQPHGIIHGGVYASIAESMTAVATALVVRDDGDIAVGQSNQTSFLRPMSEGTIHAFGRRIHRGRTTWIWEVECRDDADRLCAVVRMTIAVRPQQS